MIQLDGEIDKIYQEDGKEYVKCSLLADDKPSPLPTTGADIKGLKAEQYLAPGSMIVTKNAEVCIMGPAGWGNWL